MGLNENWVKLSLERPKRGVHTHTHTPEMSAKAISRLRLQGVISLILPVELWAVGLAAELVNLQDMLPPLIMSMQGLYLAIWLAHLFTAR